MSEDNRNIVLFGIIAGLILLGWPLFANKFLPAPPKPVPAKIAAAQAPATGAGPGLAADGTAIVRYRTKVLAETPRIAIETPALKGSINLTGARIDDLVLLRHRETVAKNSDPVRLL